MGLAGGFAYGITNRARFWKTRPKIAAIEKIAMYVPSAQLNVEYPVFWATERKG
jgi:hypothetical protein